MLASSLALAQGNPFRIQDDCCDGEKISCFVKQIESTRRERRMLTLEFFVPTIRPSLSTKLWPTMS